MSYQAHNTCYHGNKWSKFNKLKDKTESLGENNVKYCIRSGDVNLKQKDSIQLFANVDFKLLHGFVFVRNSNTKRSITNDFLDANRMNVKGTKNIFESIKDSPIPLKLHQLYWLL